MQTSFTPASSAQPRYRSGAVARMVRIPVSTLRIWERRYQVVGPSVTASGHRLYSGADVERLLLIKQLIDLGHAIGSLARLDTAALLDIADARAVLDAQPAAAPPRRPRAVLLGLGLPRRLGALALRRVATWADLAAAEAALGAAGPGTAAPPPAEGAAGAPVADLLVADVATLQPESAERLLALARRLGVQHALVVYGFGTESAAQRLRQAGWRLQRAPLADAELCAQAVAAMGLPPGDPGALAWPVPTPAAPVPPRRFDDAALQQLATAASSVACECPRHVADLVTMLCNFETYSIECSDRGAAAAHPRRPAAQHQALHQQLHRLAGQARAMFEAALVALAEAEALPVPPAPDALAADPPARPGKPLAA